MKNQNEITEILQKMHKCKDCKFYNTMKYIESRTFSDEYRDKIAICDKKGSGRYKVGLHSVCCEFYELN